MKRITLPITFVQLSDVVGDDDGFCELIANDAPFSWGDNDFSIITAGRLADHAEECDHRKEYTDLIQQIRDLGDTYINLEG